MSKKSIEAKIRNRRLALPNKLLVRVVLFIFRRMIKKNRVEYIYHYDVEKYRNLPVILLGQHAAKDDFLWAPSGYIGKTPNYLCGIFHFYYRDQQKLLMKVGAIPKFLYQTDFYAIKDIDRIIKMGGSIAIFPEGIQSTSGSNHPINPATIKFLMKYKLPVILYKTQGGYLTNPRFSSIRRHGKVTCSYELLFDTSDYEQYNQDQLYERLMEKFTYNDFEYNQVARIPYVGKCFNAEGLDKILYKCPKCQSEFKLQIEKDSIVCMDCGNKILVNEYYDLIPYQDSKAFKNIDEWYKWQRFMVQKEIKSKDFAMSCSCYLLGIDKYKVRRNPEIVVGKGNITLNQDGLIYQGEVNHKKQELFFKIEMIPSIPFTPGKNIDMHYQNEYYGFEPLENKNQVVKWMLVAEEFHNAKNELWDKVSRDAYQYIKKGN